MGGNASAAAAHLIWGDMWRCGEIWGDVGRCGEIWGIYGGERLGRGDALGPQTGRLPLRSLDGPLALAQRRAVPSLPLLHLRRPRPPLLLQLRHRPLVKLLLPKLERAGIHVGTEPDMGRYGGDMGEIWGRCGGDMGEIWGDMGRYGGDMRRYGGDMRASTSAPSLVCDGCMAVTWRSWRLHMAHLACAASSAPLSLLSASSSAARRALLRSAACCASAARAAPSFASLT